MKPAALEAVHVIDGTAIDGVKRSYYYQQLTLYSFGADMKLSHVASTYRATGDYLANQILSSTHYDWHKRASAFMRL